MSEPVSIMRQLALAFELDDDVARAVALQVVDGDIPVKDMLKVLDKGFTKSVIKNMAEAFLMILEKTQSLGFKEKGNNEDNGESK